MTAALHISHAGSAAADRPTLEECYATHRAFVFHRCLRYGAGDVAFAEEVTQDVFVKLLEHLPQPRLLARPKVLDGMPRRPTA